MKLQKGIFKLVHGFPYADDAPFETKVAVSETHLVNIKEAGYDGVVLNVDFADGYIDNEANWRLVEEKARLCKKHGLRLWIYDEKWYPSGAAGVKTLSDDPSLEAKALVAVHKVLMPGESGDIPLPYGHIQPMGAFAYYFGDDKVTQSDLCAEPLRPDYGKNGYHFVNEGDKKLLCLAFFTKPAFEGTHCQHNAASQRRYIDLSHPKAGEAFVKNTYEPYCRRLLPYIKDGTVEAFFMDEPSYMAVYFNLEKIPRVVNHIPDPKLPLYAMVNWSDGLEDRFEDAYGDSLLDQLPFLFFSEGERAEKLRKRFYMLLTELARRNFFSPIAKCCESYGVLSSGHILLEERITDHPRYQGSFFSILKTMHVPGMDMLDSLPERIWKKAFTPLLVSSVSRLHREGDVMDEVSCHFQNKYGIKVSARQLFTSLAMQHFLGVSVFHSYYMDGVDPICAPTFAGESTLKAFSRLLKSTEEALPYDVFLHYPIEGVMANTVNPVDVATVYDSILNEYSLPYPLDRKDLKKKLSLDPLVEDASSQRASAIQSQMEECMFALMDRQIPFGFIDTPSLADAEPRSLVIYADAVESELFEMIPELLKKGWRVYAVNGAKPLPKGVISIEGARELQAEFSSVTDGDARGVVSMHTASSLYLANSTAMEKSITLGFTPKSVYEPFEDRFISLCESNSFVLPPYGVVVVKK